METTTNRTIDAKVVADVLKEIMLCINNPNFEVYSACDGAVNIIENFTTEYKQIPFRKPTVEEYEEYAFPEESESSITN